jgi:hypothetical protein
MVAAYAIAAAAEPAFAQSNTQLCLALLAKHRVQVRQA